MFENLESTTILEVAPTRSNGDLFWIYEIENPSGFFTGCNTPSDVSDQIIGSEKDVDETIETCGYTMVLDRPEDPLPDKAGDPPYGTTVMEITQKVEYDQLFSVTDVEHKRGKGNEHWDKPIRLYEISFYRIEEAHHVFKNSWGNTTEMFEAIQSRGIDPLLSYDDVSFVFNRPYGSL